MYSVSNWDSFFLMPPPLHFIFEIATNLNPFRFFLMIACTMSWFLFLCCSYCMLVYPCSEFSSCVNYILYAGDSSRCTHFFVLPVIRSLILLWYFYYLIKILHVLYEFSCFICFVFFLQGNKLLHSLLLASI